MTRVELEHPLEDVHDFHKVHLPEHNEKMERNQAQCSLAVAGDLEMKTNDVSGRETGQRGNENFYYERYCNLRTGN